MVAAQKTMYVVDPKLPEMPSSKELKRMLLLALRCCDTEVKHRPTMGNVIYMLEPRDLLLNDVRIEKFSSETDTCITLIYFLIRNCCLLCFLRLFPGASDQEKSLLLRKSHESGPYSSQIG